MAENKLPQKKEDKIILADTDLTVPGDMVAGLLDLIKSRQDKIVKLSFDVDPVKSNSDMSSLYYHRTNLVPPYLLKRIRDSEELIGGAILPVRARQVASFGRPRPSRFDVGFAIYLKPEMAAILSEEEQDRLKKEELPKIRNMLSSCGREDGLTDREKLTLSQALMEMTEDILTFGCFVVEIRNDESGKFHSWRPIDAGTIYFIVNFNSKNKEIERLRENAAKLLSQIEGHNIDIPRFQNNEYTYVQVVEDTPRQAFTDSELLYWQGSPSTDINRSGYPVSPIERIISAITTHINLTTHNKMYFLNGRAARNILIFQSENLEENDIIQIKNQMVAHINSANAAWRMPVFGIGPNDRVTLQPLETGSSRDMEFQYLADLNKRMIFAAYQMSPDEIASLAYLSKGTNAQSLSESSNEYKLEASRDSGLRPLLLSIEDFLNLRLLPRINPAWAKYFQISIEGLDSDSPQLESTKLVQDQALYLSMNDIMSRVEKKPVPIGGDFPLNPGYLQLLEKYFTKGEILKAFGGKKYEDADQDPDLQYYMADPVWLNLYQTQQQMALQEQQMQAQQSQLSGESGQNEESGLSEGQDLNDAMGQLKTLLHKTEKISSPQKRSLLQKLNHAKRLALSAYKKDSKESLDKILNMLKKSEDDDHNHGDE